MVADKLYDSAADRAAIRRPGAEPHIPRRYGLRAERFAYGPVTDTLRCPLGHTSTHRTRDSSWRSRYTFSPRVCRGCPEAALCPPPNKGRIRITLADHHRARLSGAPSSGRLIEYECKRIERKFGQTKTNHGLGRARYWGKAKMLIQELLTFFVLNAKRTVRLLSTHHATPAPVTA